jgi:hypothetical protein
MSTWRGLHAVVLWHTTLSSRIASQLVSLSTTSTVQKAVRSTVQSTDRLGGNKPIEINQQQETAEPQEKGDNQQGNPTAYLYCIEGQQATETFSMGREKSLDVQFEGVHEPELIQVNGSQQ